jgi:hypothetical protein
MNKLHLLLMAGISSMNSACLSERELQSRTEVSTLQKPLGRLVRLFRRELEIGFGLPRNLASITLIWNFLQQDDRIVTEG